MASGSSACSPDLDSASSLEYCSFLGQEKEPLLGFETDGAAECRRVHDCGRVVASEVLEDAEAPLLTATSEYLQELG